MTNPIEQSIQSIRDYTAKHPLLQASNHFAFDVLLNLLGPPADVVVFALNQAEYGEDRVKRAHSNACLEDTSIGTFRDPTKLGKARRWYKKVEARIGAGRRAVLGELFFWSTKNSKVLYERFGRLTARSKHLQFCRDRNLELLAHYQPRVVVVVGLSLREAVAELYGLREVGRPLISGEKTIARFYSDGHRPWLFSQHWTGARGLTKGDWALWDQTVKGYLS